MMVGRVEHIIFICFILAFSLCDRIVNAGLGPEPVFESNEIDKENFTPSLEKNSHEMNEGMDRMMLGQPDYRAYFFNRRSYEQVKSKRYIDRYTELIKMLKCRPSVENKISPFDYAQTTPSAITLDFSPSKILEVFERQQSVAIASFVAVKWNDDALRWNPPEFNNITHVFIEAEDIWTPTILLPTANGDGFTLRKPEYMLIDITKKYNVRWATLFKFTSACDLDMSLFPFDSQNCTVTFQEENNRLMRFKDQSNTPEDLKSMNTNSGEWIINSWEARVLSNEENGTAKSLHQRIYPGQKPSVIAYSISITRRSTYYVANLLFPLFATSFLSLFVFWIPPQSGERIAFMISIFVSMAMYISFIDRALPHSIEKLPVFNAITVLTNAQIILTLIVIIIVLHLHEYHPTQDASSSRNIKSSDTACEVMPKDTSSHLNRKGQGKSLPTIAMQTNHLDKSFRQNETETADVPWTNTVLYPDNFSDRLYPNDGHDPRDEAEAELREGKHEAKAPAMCRSCKRLDMAFFVFFTTFFLCMLGGLMSCNK